MCYYRTDDGKCRKFTDDKYTSYCVDGPCPDDTPTNADKIRGMTDEGLAAYIFELGNYTEYCYGHCAYQDDDELCKAHSSRGLKQKGCIRGVIEWLQMPAETEGTE